MACSDLMPEVIENPQQHFRLVVTGNAGKWGARLGTGGVTAAAQVVEAENPEPIDVERTVGTCDLRPPLLTGVVG